MLSKVKYSSLGWLMRSMLALWAIDVNAQGTNTAQEIEITYNKTSSLVFPAMIKSVDRGSRDVLAQKAKGIENVLQLKAARSGFAETNLTVITADGVIHHFNVNYAKEPDQLVLTIEDPSLSRETERETRLIFQSALTESDLEYYASRIVDSKRTVRFVRHSKNKLTLSLNGIYIRDNIIFYHLRIKNASNINYDIDFLRFYVRDRVTVKRTASQEVDRKALYVYGDDELVPANTTRDIVYALEKFTIPDAKQLHVEIFEQNGGRNMELAIGNKTIVRAKRIQ